MVNNNLLFCLHFILFNNKFIFLHFSNKTIKFPIFLLIFSLFLFENFEYQFLIIKDFKPIIKLILPFSNNMESSLDINLKVIFYINLQNGPGFKALFISLIFDTNLKFVFSSNIKLILYYTIKKFFMRAYLKKIIFICNFIIYLFSFA